MASVQRLVRLFNKQFTIDEDALKRCVDSGEFDKLKFIDAKDLYFFSNRKLQVCQMFNYFHQEKIYRHELKELQTLTKGFAVCKVMDFVYAYRGEQPLFDNVELNDPIQEELKLLKAQLAETQKNLSEVQNIALGLAKERKDLWSNLKEANYIIKKKDKTIDNLSSNLDKVSIKLDEILSIKEIQATYLRIKHNIIQKVKA